MSKADCCQCFVFILSVQVLLATFGNIAVTLRLLSTLWFIICILL